MKGERGRKFPTEQTEIRGERKTLWPGKMMRLLPRKKKRGREEGNKKGKGQFALSSRKNTKWGKRKVERTGKGAPGHTQPVEYR